MVRVENCHAGVPGSNLPRHSGIFFFLKNSRDLHSVTTFVEQKLSLCVKKLRNFMRVYVNIGRGRFEIWKHSLHEASLA